MKSTNQDGSDTMSDEQNIERGGVEVEGHPWRYGTDSEPPENTDVTDADAAEDADVEGQSVRYKRAASAEASEDEAGDSRQPAESEVEGQAGRWGSPAEVEGQAYKIRKPAEDVEGQGFRMGATDSEVPENTDVNDSTDEPEVEGQGSRFNG